MDKELQCDFVFGDTMSDVKKMDYSELYHFKREVKNKIFLRKPLYYQKGVLSLLKENYTDFLILGDLHCISTWLMLFIAPFLRKKIYLWSHAWYGRESLVKTILKKIYFNLSEGIFLYGNYAKELMLKEGFKNSKLFVIYNSLAYDEQLPLRLKLKLTLIYKKHFNNDNPNLIFIGRLTNVKRLDLLINAVAILESKSLSVNLTLIGDGEMKDNHVRQVQQLGLKNVWFYGPCYNEFELSKLIYNADLCVSPGNVGLTAIHSMTYGTPVLTHNNFQYQMPEFEAIVDRKTGTFFDYNNIISLADSIKRWFSITHKRELIRQYCYEVVDSKYNPHYQLAIFKRVLLG